MEGRFEHLHVRCRTTAVDASRLHFEARLRRIAQNELLPAFEQRLDRVLGSDPTVYVLRSVTTALTLRMGAERLDSQIASDWGVHMARSVVQRIMYGEDDALKTFANQADFVAHFLDALLHGNAWQTWYYYPFAHLRTLDVPAAAHSLLMEERTSLSEILVALANLGALDILLYRLNPDQIGALWRDGLGAVQVGAIDATRSLFVQLASVLDSLNLWAVSRPPIDERFATFLAQQPLLLDWRDTRSLTLTVIAMSQHLLARGDLRRVTGGEIASLETSLAGALQAFSYLDADHLKNAILAGLSGATSVNGERSSSEISIFPASAPVPERQRALIDDLIALLHEQPTLMNSSEADATASLRLYTALIVRAPRWAGDPLATSVLDRLLHIRSLIRRGVVPPAALTRLASGSLRDALDLLAPDQQAASAPALHFVAGLGNQAASLIKSMNAVPVSTAEPEGIATECAGVFLLLRVLLDLRLRGLVERHPFLSEPPPARWSALLLALGLRWAGKGTQSHDTIDPGLAVFAGIDITTPPMLTAQKTLWATATPSDLLDFWAAIISVLNGQRLVSNDPFQPCSVPIYGDDSSIHALVGIDAATGVLVAGRALAADENAGSISGDEALVESIRQTFHALASGDSGNPQADVTLRLISAALLRAWSRWLRQFHSSSTAYLLDNFIRRPGRLIFHDDLLIVELEARPLDVVLELAGYLHDLDRVAWLGNRRVTFRTVA